MTPDEINKILRKRKPAGKDLAMLEIHNCIALKSGQFEPVGKEDLNKVGMKLQNQNDRQQYEEYMYCVDIHSLICNLLLHAKATLIKILDAQEIRGRIIKLLAEAIDSYNLLQLIPEDKREQAKASAIYSFKLLDTYRPRSELYEAKITEIEVIKEVYLNCFYFLMNWNSLIEMLAEERGIPDLNYYQFTDPWAENYQRNLKHQDELIKKSLTALEAVTDQSMKNDITAVCKRILNFNNGSSLQTNPRRQQEVKQLIQHKQVLRVDIVDFYLSLESELERSRG